MEIIQCACAALVFGDKDLSIDPDLIRYKHVEWDNLPVQTVIFQHQVHAANGHSVTLENLEAMGKLLTYDSDYLVSNIPGIALGVLTADCLPIALIDQVHRAIGMVHAGWRGSVSRIVANALQSMSEHYGTQPEMVHAYYGPCAHTCCYQVNEQFVQQLPLWARSFAQMREDKLSFDLCTCNRAELLRLGVPPAQIIGQASVCTVCNKIFCSHRRDPQSSTRQMNIIWLK